MTSVSHFHKKLYWGNLRKTFRNSRRLCSLIMEPWRTEPKLTYTTPLGELFKKSPILSPGANSFGGRQFIIPI